MIVLYNLLLRCSILFVLDSSVRLKIIAYFTRKFLEWSTSFYKVIGNMLITMTGTIVVLNKRIHILIRVLVAK